MFTVTIGREGSGKSSTLSPFGSAYSRDAFDRRDALDARRQRDRLGRAFFGKCESAKE